MKLRHWEFFTVIIGQNQDYAVSIEYQSYSENDFDQKLGILTKLTKNFWNFEILIIFTECDNLSRANLWRKTVFSDIIQ